MSDVTIVCPSFHRAGAVKTFAAFGEDLLLLVAQRQFDEYRAIYPSARIDCHPDDLHGMSPVRQWMYEKYGDLFMVDDDVPVMFDHTSERIGRCEPAKARDVIQRLHDQAADMGLFLFGTSDDPNPLHFQPHRPFRLTGVVRGRAMGIRAGSRLWFPTDPVTDDEMSISGLNAYQHRCVLVDNRYALAGDEYTPGGWAARRTTSTIDTWVDKLQGMFGSAIVKQKMGDASLVVPW